MCAHTQTITRTTERGKKKREYGEIGGKQNTGGKRKAKLLCLCVLVALSQRPQSLTREKIKTKRGKKSIYQKKKQHSQVFGFFLRISGSDCVVGKRKSGVYEEKQAELILTTKLPAGYSSVTKTRLRKREVMCKKMERRWGLEGRIHVLERCNEG